MTGDKIDWCITCNQPFDDFCGNYRDDCQLLMGGNEISFGEAIELAMNAGKEARRLQELQREQDAAFYDDLYGDTEIRELQEELSFIISVLQEYAEAEHYDELWENEPMFLQPVRKSSYKMQIIKDLE